MVPEATNQNKTSLSIFLDIARFWYLAPCANIYLIGFIGFTGFGHYRPRRFIRLLLYILLRGAAVVVLGAEVSVVVGVDVVAWINLTLQNSFNRITLQEMTSHGRAHGHGRALAISLYAVCSFR